MLPSALDGRRIAATRTSLAHHFNFVPASVSGFMGIYALISEGEYFSLPALQSGRDVLTIRMDGTPCDEEPTNRTGKGIPGHKGPSLGPNRPSIRKRLVANGPGAVHVPGP